MVKVLVGVPFPDSIALLIYLDDDVGPHTVLVAAWHTSLHIGGDVVGDPLEDEPYGLAVATDHPEFARFINTVLARARADGTWNALYAKWLQPSLGPASAPAPDYGRTP